MAEKKAAFDRKMPVEFKNIPPPCLDEIRMVLEAGLKKNYEEAAVEIVDCPDLTQEPFKLAAKVKTIFKNAFFLKNISCREYAAELR